MIDRRLAPLLPTPAQTLFLRACLHDAPGAADAWDRWLRQATHDGTPARVALAEYRSFLPLLEWNLRRNRIPADRRLQTHLRSACFTEELRLGSYHAICASAFRRLDAAGIPFIVLKGAALGTSAYPAPLLRHADDLDVLLEEADLTRATHVLAAHGWGAADPPTLPNPIHLPPMMHRSGVSLELHRRLLLPYYTVPLGALWARSEMVPVAGVQVRVLSAPDSLLHACAHGMGSVAILRWVPDAWFILKTQPLFDWPLFTATVVASRLALPLSVALWYLAEQMHLPVPPDARGEIDAHAARTGRSGRVLARPWPDGSVRELWSRPGPWWMRLGLVWRRAFPPPLQFARHCDIGLWQVPYYYARRAWRMLGHRGVAAGRRTRSAPRSARPAERARSSRWTPSR